MSSSSSANPSAYTERRPANDSSSVPLTKQDGRRTGRDSRRDQSLQHSASMADHQTSISSSQRTNKGIEERKVERIQIMTRETLTSRTRSSEAQPGRSQSESLKPSEASGAYSGESCSEVNERGTPEIPWTPKAFLTPHTTGPLSSRISTPPLASEAPRSLQPIPLQELSLGVQEAAILNDLLTVFMGYEGQYIRFAQNYEPSIEKDRLSGPSFEILPGLDPSLQNLTTTMLKIATYYGAVKAFVEVQTKEEFGAILKQTPLLGEANEDSEGDVDDIENILETLREGVDLGQGKNICKGGTVLRLITKRLELMSGDPAAKALLTSLLGDASRPYMIMLNEWLHNGSINDPYAEFLVREQKSIGRERLKEDYTDEYWDRRYTIRENDVPPQLEGVKDKILLAGKYLNVVRECGKIDVRAVKDAPQTFADNRFLDNVNNAYAHANESLLELLLTTYALPARLRSLKHYFFLDRSDFFSSFLELGTSELRKPVDKVNTNKLQSLLDLVLRQPGSIAAQDPFKEDVKIEMNRVSLTNSLTRVVNISGMEQGETLGSIATRPTEPEKAAIGFTSLQLDYSVPFPVSLVISRKTIWRYQVLFLHNRAATWSHKSSNQEVELWKRRVFTLRARMLIFVQQLLYFCTSEVIEPKWQALMQKLESKDGVKPAIHTVDELMRDHVDFLDTCLKECMLTNKTLLKRHRDAPPPPPPPPSAGGGAEVHVQHVQLEKMEDMIGKYEFNFSKHLQILLDALNHYAATETVLLLGLCARLSIVNQRTEFDGLGNDEQAET
ncbi:hypothetical protein B7463_g2840, partial [Scytalidium lignicola]